MPADLPIDEALPALLGALRQDGQAVLQAPPGAGKTTRVPLALLEAGAFHGRLVMLEPRRLAARAAAARMAETLGEETGQTVGYRIRGETRRSGATRIEVVTEGILTRMIQSDPELAGIGALVFDEFHERSLNADLGLALSLELRGALRPDLKLLVMSATLDTAPVAALMGGAPVVTSEGRAHPVETRYLERPWRRPGERDPRLAEAAADLTARALAESAGGVLVFLPGEGEIRQTEARLAGRLPTGCAIRPLFGAMDLAAQRAAIAPAAEGRKVVLATAIAETSLTIEDIRVVVDAGRARRARFDPGSGMTRLVTERVTRAEAEQRRGRAGRVAPGICYRMWTPGEDGALAAHPPAEIEAADLAGLALELALWGVRDAADLPFLTPPNPGALAEAGRLLTDLGALDAAGAITAHGREMAGLPMHPRLAHMLRRSGAEGPRLAALLAERDPLTGAPADLTRRIEALRDPKRFAAERPYGINRARLERIRAEARRLPRGRGPDRSLAEMAALAYPDRIGLRRPGDAARFILSGGKGAVLDPGDTLAGARLIVATDLDGDAREARVRLAVAITEAELRGLYADRIEWEDICRWSRRARAVQTRRQERFGALVLADRSWRDCPPERIARAALDGVRELGLEALGFSRKARLLQARVEFLRAEGAALPDFSDAGLLEAAGDWLLPWLTGRRSAADLKALDLLEPLLALLNHTERQTLDRLAPAQFTAPTGSRVAIDYGAETPEIAIRLQEMFGQATHPAVGPARRPLRITLLSPAQRPVQTTSDLPGFWANSYADVRRDMRGRYPRHPWPKDPLAAVPTRRVKPRGA
ncbi:ATP-dependent helicase HrpB [Maritimibacter sp. 55A14]|uniref:ATP-dependent helicase HrpB n=1 Tax=Maritimibacter sp. 55A14 TaxID=2174844 RepID=UPI000D60BEF6|nr:ATP-dependent helicase HrpB [Maritimibacter sp. 55A14]PWE32020.1 ATP-dependent helicase HrpB [Maritimibacter sp. 55A14]